MLEVPRPFYTRSLQREAIRRVLDEGKQPDHVARELALSEQTVRDWIDQAEEISLTDLSDAELGADPIPGVDDDAL